VHSRESGCGVVLIGMMGSGKTTLGRLLAEKTGWPRYDNDQLLMELYGMTASELVATRGDHAKRDAEDAALLHGLTHEAPFILDAAGGSIESAASRQALAEPIVIWLRASPATLYRRSLGATHRPFLDEGEAWFRSTAERRGPLYASVADITIDTDEREPAEIAGELVTRIEQICEGG